MSAVRPSGWPCRNKTDRLRVRYPSRVVRPWTSAERLAAADDHISGMAKLGIVALLALLGAALWYAIGLWNAVETGPMPPELYVALTLGVLFSLVVGIGLMALVFYSSRRGYDDQAGGPRPGNRP